MVLLFILVLLTSFIICRNLPLTSELDDLPAHYFHMSSYLSSVDHQVAKGATLFLGDSHIQSFCIPCFFPGGVNFGIGHDTTVGLLHRVAGYRSVNKAERLVMLIGTNDMRRRSSREIIDNTADILSLINPQTSIYWISIPPVDEQVSSRHGLKNDKINEVNVSIAALCGQHPNCTFVDVTPALSGNTGQLKRTLHRGDGLHLNKNGYQLLANELTAIFDSK